MATRSKKKCHPYDSGYPFEKIVIRLNSCAIRLKNSHLFKRLTTFRNHFCPNEPGKKCKLKWTYLILLSILYHDLMNFHVTFSAE